MVRIRDRAVKSVAVGLLGLRALFTWGGVVRRLARATGVRRAGPLMPTYWLRQEGWPLSVPLPLDQVWATGGGRIKRRPMIGSDHAGLLARVSLDAD